MIMTFSQVALGGAIGACLRFGAGQLLIREGHTGLPLAVLSVNIIGSFLMGIFVVLAAHKGLTHYSPFVMTGVLGGFTTFSAFSLETVTLIQRQDLTAAGLYVVLSVGLSLAGLMAGLWLARGIFA